MKCRVCKKDIPNDSRFCTYCGAKAIPIMTSNKIRCVRCGSDDLQVVSDVRAKGASGGQMFLGGSLCGGASCVVCPMCAPLGAVLGAMFGMDGAGETYTRTLWVCKSCGAKFRV